jgi:hypothetical protein
MQVGALCTSALGMAMPIPKAVLVHQPNPYKGHVRLKLELIQAQYGTYAISLG